MSEGPNKAIIMQKRETQKFERLYAQFLKTLKPKVLPIHHRSVYLLPSTMCRSFIKDRHSNIHRLHQTLFTCHQQIQSKEATMTKARKDLITIKSEARSHPSALGTSHLDPYKTHHTLHQIQKITSEPHLHWRRF